MNIRRCSLFILMITTYGLLNSGCHSVSSLSTSQAKVSQQHFGDHSLSNTRHHTLIDFPVGYQEYLNSRAKQSEHRQHQFLIPAPGKPLKVEQTIETPLVLKCDQIKLVSDDLELTESDDEQEISTQDHDGQLKSYPIDLPTVLRLAGAENWGVALAAERISESLARYDAAKAMWLPSLNIGLGYTKHDGQIQATNGQILDISRNSLFIGGGATSNNSPLTGGAGGPARMFVDLSLTDAFFEPLAACQMVKVAEANHSATFNDTLLEAVNAYYNLVQAQGQYAIALANQKNAEEVYQLTKAFVTAGKGAEADVSRAQVEVASRKQAALQAEAEIKMASAELVRLLQMDPEKFNSESVLYTVEEKTVPIELVSEAEGLSHLIKQGQENRPEVYQQNALLDASTYRMQAERWRPWIPNVHMGSSVGVFGGGMNGNLNSLDGRADFDLLAIWQLRNLGFGNAAAQKERESQYQQALINNFRIRDLVATQVTQAYYQVQAYRKQFELAEQNVKQAQKVYEQNLKRIRGLEGLPLEALQAMQTVAETQRVYLATIIQYNQWQTRLLRAIGQPVAEDKEG